MKKKNIQIWNRNTVNSEFRRVAKGGFPLNNFRKI